MPLYQYGTPSGLEWQIHKTRLGVAGRNEEIEMFKTLIRHMGTLEIPVLFYNGMDRKKYAYEESFSKEKLIGGFSMTHEIIQGTDSLVMNEKDDVATVLRDKLVGESIRYHRGESLETLVLLDAIAFGHKVAITRIKQGSDIYKYGDVIGRATQDIEPGEHVHVHNIEGVRGRGDLAHKNKGAQ